jgi:amino acid transporter
MVKKKDNEINSTPEKPKLSLMSGIALLVGSIIGSGIFISPRGVLVGTGEFKLYSFYRYKKLIE